MRRTKRFTIEHVECVRHATYRLEVMLGAERLVVTVYPGDVPMRIFSVSDGVDWLEHDISDKHRKLIRKACGS